MPKGSAQQLLTVCVARLRRADGLAAELADALATRGLLEATS